MIVAADDDPTSRLALPHAGLLGAVVGRYRLVSRIGRGGMSEVYLAEHTDPAIDRRVAVKVLRGEYCAERSLVERAVNEARALARFRHPAVVEVFDVARTADGRPCMIMELLRGESLREMLGRHGRIPVTASLSITWQIADAMAAAHAAGIIHRDLKPDNVFLLPSLEGPRVKVLDFGVSKLLGPQHGAHALTVAGRGQLGTARYMSPEQILSARDVDARTDVYSLGCVLFELITGRPVFEQAGPVSLMNAHLHQQPPLELLETMAPPRVVALVAKMLAKPRVARMASMLDVTRAIASLPTDRSAGASPYRGGWLVIGALAVVATAAALVTAFTP